MNSNFSYRWSPASLTFNNYFYLFFYLYITRITINSNTTHLKSPKNQNRRAALGWPAMILLEGGWRRERVGAGGGGLQLVCGRSTLTLSSALVLQTLSCLKFIFNIGRCKVDLIENKKGVGRRCTNVACSLDKRRTGKRDFRIEKKLFYCMITSRANASAIVYTMYAYVSHVT